MRISNRSRRAKHLSETRGLGRRVRSRLARLLSLLKVRVGARRAQTPTLPPRFRKWLLLALAVGLVALLGASIYVSRQSHSALFASGTSPQGATPFPGVAAIVTAVRRLPTLSPEQARPYDEISKLVRECNEFHPNRQIAVLQHLTWLTHPGDVPMEFIAIYGDRWPAKLVFGAAYLTAVEWKAAGTKQVSCLIPIGMRLNDLLIEMGEDPLSEFPE